MAGAQLKRGQLLRDADINRERRDLLTTGTLTDLDLNDTGLEVAENVMPGIALTSRSVRLRAIVHRGKLADAIITDGP